MALLDDLVSQIPDMNLRGRLQKAITDLRRKQKFGLVFEEHIPETAAIFGLPIQVGALVQRRQDSDASTVFRVGRLIDRGKNAVLVATDGHEETVPVADLLVVKRFGEPMYAALKPIDRVKRGPEEAPYHAVVNGENFHTLQLFTYLYEKSVDCIYIDPPYNTGARDWKYNNRFVDSNDAWRHSKWLAMMERRLLLAKQLLRSDGVLIVTIDENELHHLGMLLEGIFPEYLRYMITIVNNPKGVAKRNFARVDEQAIFCCPNIGRDLITPVPMTARDNVLDSISQQFLGEAVELLDTLGTSDAAVVEFIARYEQAFEGAATRDEFVLDDEDGTDEVSAEENPDYEFQHARRRGTDSHRADRPTMFFPIYIDEESRTPVRTGPPVGLDEEPNFNRVDGLRPIWPIDRAGAHRRWQVGRDAIEVLIESGDLVLGSYNKKQDSWTINIRKPRKTSKQLKTVWWETRHDAGTHGTDLLARLLGRPRLFDFPKSIYATKDCLAAVVRNRPNALILDFFGGSGTTLHSTAMLNAEDGGSRRCVLVTNNEVEEKTARRLNSQGYFIGDPEFEAHGIFEQVAMPRCKAAIAGKRSDGTPVPGKYIDGRPFSSGFDENLEFYQLQYLDPDEVDLGEQFRAIHRCCG